MLGLLCIWNNLSLCCNPRDSGSTTGTVVEQVPGWTTFRLFSHQPRRQPPGMALPKTLFLLLQVNIQIVMSFSQTLKLSLANWSGLFCLILGTLITWQRLRGRSASRSFVLRISQEAKKQHSQKWQHKDHDNKYFQLTAAFEKLTYTEAGVKAPSKDVDQVWSPSPCL